MQIRADELAGDIILALCDLRREDAGFVTSKDRGEIGVWAVRDRREMVRCQNSWSIYEIMSLDLDWICSCQQVLESVRGELPVGSPRFSRSLLSISTRRSTVRRSIPRALSSAAQWLISRGAFKRPRAWALISSWISWPGCACTAARLIMHKVARVGICIFDFVKFFRSVCWGFASNVDNAIQSSCLIHYNYIYGYDDEILVIC
jgi:hypothetical protein